MTLGTAQQHSDSPGIYITRQQLLDLRREHADIATPVQRQQDTGLVGDLLSTLKGDGIEVRDIRPYQPGDEVRHIDWRTTARTGQPYTREYTEETRQSVYIGVDQRIDMFFGSDSEFKSVCAARIAGTLAWAALSHGLKLGATVVGIGPEPDDGCQLASVRTGPSAKTTLKLIDILAQYNNQLRADCAPGNDAEILLQLLERCAAHASARATVYIVSDFHGFNTETARVIHQLGRRYTLVLVRVSDAVEEQMPGNGVRGISDGKARRAIALTKAVRTTYLQERARFLEQLQSSARQANARLLHHIIGGPATTTAATRQSVAQR
jgi:uncharacterized protein (DUF58 family)